MTLSSPADAWNWLQSVLWTGKESSRVSGALPQFSGKSTLTPSGQSIDSNGRLLLSKGLHFPDDSTLDTAGGGGGALTWTQLYAGGATLDNGWKCYLAISVAKEANGMVHMVGSLDATAGVTGGVLAGWDTGGSASAFTLPVGYRPYSGFTRFEFPSVGFDNSANFYTVSAMVRINSDGTVRVGIINGEGVPKSLGLWCSFYAGP